MSAAGRAALAAGIGLLPVNLAVLVALLRAPLPPAHLPLEVAGAPEVRAARAAAPPPAAALAPTSNPAAVSTLDAIFEARVREAAARAGRDPGPLLPDPALRAAARAAPSAADPSVDALLRAWAAAMAAVGAPLRAGAPPAPAPAVRPARGTAPPHQ